MRVARVLVPLLLICAIGVTGGLLLHYRQKEKVQAIANYQAFQAQTQKDSELLAEIESRSSKQLNDYWLSLVNMDSPTPQKILEREQLETQYLSECFASQKQEAISSGMDQETIQAIDQTMHKEEAEAIKDANDFISDLEKRQTNQ